MHMVKFWLLLVALNISAMERSPLAANYQITTLPDQKRVYKCLLCNYRPVSREASFLNHWTKNHPKVFDYTMEILKESLEQCKICTTFHLNQNSLRLHILRNHHKNEKIRQRKNSLSMLEKKAIFNLYALSQSTLEKN